MSPGLALLEERYGTQPARLVKELSALFRAPALDLGELRACDPAFDVVSFVDARRRSCAALRDRAAGLLVVTADPCDGPAQDWVEAHVKQPFAWRVAHPRELAAWFAEQEEGLRAMDGVATEAPADEHGKDTPEITIDAIDEAQSAVVRLVNSTLYDAMKSGASDIHLETGAAGLVVRYRVDGVLSLAASVERADFAEQAISRVKVMAELDIAERRVPQDGRFRARVRGREVDFRVSIMPSAFGEDAVLRILDKEALASRGGRLDLEGLGFEPAIAKGLRRLAAEPHGMLLVTGPTGSGKTTTLYAVISEAMTGLNKIVTIEDPVEYQLPGVLQIPVNEKKGLTFARGLRSILRHDPDRILVGEIRDPETAEIAVQSALTGHLVYTTVHANNVFDVIARFQHMRVDPYHLASALNGVMAQRLVRVHCRGCAGRGCAECRGTGFRGRRAIAELMVLDDELREMIASRAPIRALREAARAAGTGTLREAALELIRRGETSTEEIDRVTSASA